MTIMVAKTIVVHKGIIQWYTNPLQDTANVVIIAEILYLIAAHAKETFGPLLVIILRFECVRMTWINLERTFDNFLYNFMMRTKVAFVADQIISSLNATHGIRKVFSPSMSSIVWKGK